MGFTFKTDSGHSYNALSDVAKNGAPSLMVKNSLPVGSGIIARIRGTVCNFGSTNNFGQIGAFGIEFLDELRSISITNMTYSGFTDNIAPAGPGNSLTVGSEILDNRGSSIQQQMMLITSDAVTKSHEVSIHGAFMIGGSLTWDVSAGIPDVSSTRVSTSVNWAVTVDVVSLCLPPNLI